VEPFAERRHARVHEAQFQRVELAVDLVGAVQVLDAWRLVLICAAIDVFEDTAHGRTLAP
jgi:hypothetical protein